MELFMVNFDRPFSALSSRFKAIAAAATSVSRPRLTAMSSAVRPRMTAINSAVRPRLTTINAAISPQVTAFTSAASPRIKALATAPPRVKLIAAGATLAFMTGLSAPAIAATQTAPTQSAHNAAVAAAVAPNAPAAAVAPHAPGAPAAPAAAAVAAGAAAPQAKQDAKQDGKQDGKQDAPAPAAPTIDQLHPTGIQGDQVGFTPTTDQMRNAQMIIQEGQALGLPARAWVIAVATSLQESTLTNYGDLGMSNDHDSLGLFQQRPSSGWGSPSQLENPTYASKAFYQALTQVPNWDKLNLTDAAQAVQVSAFPDNYAKWEAHAGDIVNAFYGQGPLASIAHQVM
jgi:hypothetical protein